VIRYHPIDLIKKISPPSKIEKLIRGNLTPNKAALSFLDGADFLSKDSVARVALKTIKQYKAKYDDLKDQDVPAADAKEEATNDNKLLINRVQNNIVNQVADEIEDQYSGEYYIWLPSDASEPDPLHQLKYGRKFQLGKGEKPGDRYGCRCGMSILVKETKLKL
jgi:hypothetical protein